MDLGEEDDELLRAAEELGIDLSGVRADGKGDGAADEQEEQVVAEGEGGTNGDKAKAEAAKAVKE